MHWREEQARRRYAAEAVPVQALRHGFTVCHALGEATRALGRRRRAARPARSRDGLPALALDGPPPAHRRQRHRSAGTGRQGVPVRRPPLAAARSARFHFRSRRVERDPGLPRRARGHRRRRARHHPPLPVRPPGRCPGGGAHPGDPVPAAGSGHRRSLPASRRRRPCRLPGEGPPTRPRRSRGGGAGGSEPHRNSAPRARRSPDRFLAPGERGRCGGGPARVGVPGGDAGARDRRRGPRPARRPRRGRPGAPKKFPDAVDRDPGRRGPRRHFRPRRLCATAAFRAPRIGERPGGARPFPRGAAGGPGNSAASIPPERRRTSPPGSPTRRTSSTPTPRSMPGRN